MAVLALSSTLCAVVLALNGGSVGANAASGVGATVTAHTGAGRVLAPSNAPSRRETGKTTLVVEPSDGYRSIYALLAGAQRSIDITMYELADPNIVVALVAAHRRQVAVRVMLDRALQGSSVNRAAFIGLSRAGVAVHFAPSSVIFHQKTVTVDGRTSAIMTGNLTPRYYPTTRDFIVMDTDRRTVSTIESVFDRDWAGSAVTAGAAIGGLVWSPGAAPRLLTLINGARRSLVIENEEMDSTVVESALEAASRRGVSVTLIMTGDSSWVDALARLRLAGVRLVVHPDGPHALYVHAKAMVIDGTTAYVGSQNFSQSSLDFNRELGVVTSNSTLVSVLADTLMADSTGAS
jgi:cardiolipin synthase